MKLKSISVLLALAGASVAARADDVRFLGVDRNWFNPFNWSSGQIPGPLDNVYIGPGLSAVIDPALGTNTVFINNLTVFKGSLTTKRGTRFGVGGDDILIGGTTTHEGTDASAIPGTDGGVGRYEGLGLKWEGLTLNPTPKSRRDVILKTSLTMGLGGTIPASAGNFGPGHYATLSATETIDIQDAELDLKLCYGFVPREGQVFKLVSAGTALIGTFKGLPEGAVIKRFGNLVATIHYSRGEASGPMKESMATMKKAWKDSSR